MKVLAGIHVGCFELFVNDAIGRITDLAGKKVGIRALGSPEHLFVSVIAANVGIDPKWQIDWVVPGTAVPAHRCSGIRCCPRYGENSAHREGPEKFRTPLGNRGRFSEIGQPQRQPGSRLCPVGMWCVRLLGGVR
jgi:hypothetical protein